VSSKPAKSFEEGLVQIKALVAAFEKDAASITSKYNETQLRNDFIDPLLMSLGWDVNNEDRKSQFLRDVIQEEFIDIGDDAFKRNPDYTLLANGHRKFFLEAKKPSINIANSAKSAFQIRRYGWSAKLGISVLTNFEKLIIYDCRIKPDAKDNEHVARFKVFEYREFAASFEELYKLLSFESAGAGKLDEFFEINEKSGEPFDDFFLIQIERWRQLIGESAVKKNPSLNDDTVNFLIQRLLNRIVFLRICEDREIEKAETLKKVKNYTELKALFTKSDEKYNSGLFNFIEDTLSMNVEIDEHVLVEIFNELYYPLSPFNFAVVDSTILSQIYEKFLGSRAAIGAGRALTIIEHDEVAASSGVVSTPKTLVEQIVAETLTPIVSSISSKEILQLKIADICCGAGTFLISVYDFLEYSLIEKLQREGVKDPDILFEISKGTLALSFKLKRQLLAGCVFGVDINPYAVEVTEFSLLLRLLEEETEGSLNHFSTKYHEQILPDLSATIKCGNSLVDKNFYAFHPGAETKPALIQKVNPFTWVEEFSFLSTKGFDAIVGNPPYVRIQNLMKYVPEEVQYYKSDVSGYQVAKKDTFDKYYVFIQRAISLLNPHGLLGYIVPNKFFIVKGGELLRDYIVENSFLSRIIHFGVTQVFPNRSTYTAILILQKESRKEFPFRRVKKLTLSALQSDNSVLYPNKKFGSDPWVFVSPQTQAVFDKVAAAGVVSLETVSDIVVGVQTSADEIYIFVPDEETEHTFKFTKDGNTWEVEKDICRPEIHDLQFNLFDTIAANAQIIFPYEIVDGQARLFSEEQMAERFPLCWAYLNSFKEKLSKRNFNGPSPKWYQFGRSQSLTRFHDTEKLIWPVLSTHAAYILDRNNLQFTGGGNGPYYGLIANGEYSLLYILAILSHPIFEYMVRAGASEFRGAYYSHGKQFLKNLPIKAIDFTDATAKSRHDGLARIVQHLIDNQRDAENAHGLARIAMERNRKVLFETLVEGVNALYGLTLDDLKAVEGDDLFTTGLVTDEE
jgi:type I restriction-modification system DNA methylase subunit